MQEPLKSLDLWSDKSVFLFANEMTGGGGLSIAPNTRMGPGVRGTNHRLDGWNFRSQACWGRERSRRWC